MADPVREIWLTRFLATSRRTLREPVDILIPKRALVQIPAGKVLLELTHNEDDTGGFHSVKVCSGNAAKNWELLEDFHFASEARTEEVFHQIVDALP